jgi:hypothetical protein
MVRQCMKAARSVNRKQTGPAWLDGSSRTH